MNDLYKRERNRTLIITEGNHEKGKLLALMLLSFPEINISENNIVIYESNIYSLYRKIIKEYGEDWKSQDVDLPKNVSIWKHLPVQLTKHDFTNIILVFDYERHDPNFSEEIICSFQEYFSDINDNGQLFINYPMVESYLDIDMNNLSKFEKTKTKADIHKGTEYKAAVQNSKVSKVFSVWRKMLTELNDCVKDDFKARMLTEQILKLPQTDDLRSKIYCLLSSAIDDIDANRLSHKYEVVIKNNSEIESNYFSYTRNILFQIVISNIKKAYSVQTGVFDTSFTLKDLKEIYFDKVSLYDVLLSQNLASKDILTGFIWILNTSILIAANYTLFWDNND